MIKNIIFDLGGVIVDIDSKNVFKAFNKLGAEIDINIHPRDIDPELFDLWARHKISVTTYRFL